MIHLIFVPSSNTWKKRQTQTSQIFQTVLLCDPSVLRSRHLKHSRTCARHWERCRLLVLVAVLPVSWFHRSLSHHMFDSSRPSRPSLCRRPVSPLDCIWTWKTCGWDNIMIQFVVSVNTNKTRQTNLLELAISPEAFRQTTQLSFSLFWTVPLYIKWP